MIGAVSDLAVVVLIGAVFGVIAKLLRQPNILAYLATGMFVGAFGLLSKGGGDLFSAFSELGIMFLLFLVGMEINYTSLRLVGKAVLLIGAVQIGATFGLAYGLAHMFGFSALACLYIAISIVFSSTVIVVKLLSDKRELSSLYGKISIGVLLLQDFLAILLLVVLTGIHTGGAFSLWDVAYTVFKGVFLFAVMLYLGRRLLPYVFGTIARSHELLFLVSLAWVFLVASLVSKMGFTVEIAGFLAGIALANSSDHHRIAARIKPLRDFFLIIFFVALGAGLAFGSLGSILVPVIVFSLFVLFVKPLVVMVMMGIMGYRKRTGFKAGVAIAQVSEFSFILMALGLRLGHLDQSAVALVTTTGVISILASSYMIQFDEQLYSVFRPVLAFLEREKSVEHVHDKEKDAHSILLIGFHRLGQSIAAGLPREKLLIVEFDPDMARRLQREGYHYIFGDISDPDIFEESHIEDVSLVISTSPDIEDNSSLIAEVKKLPHHPKVVVRAETEQEAEALYNDGADYVLFPHLTSGQYFGKTIALDPELHTLPQLKEHDMKLLATIKRRDVNF